MSALRASSGMVSFAGIPPKALTFLRGLTKNNRKEWFEEHRDAYETSLRAPMKQLIEEVDVRLAEIAPEIVGSPKKSMFRIHRDVRFSKNKAPYKTNAACWFYHRDAGHGVGGEAAHGGAGFYFHVSPTEIFCGGGIWMPPREALTKLRQRLVEDPDGWEEIVLARGFRKRFGDLDTEAMLTRPPRGFDDTHPAARWLKYKSFTAGCDVSREDTHSEGLPDVLAKHYAALVPFVRWLNGAMGMKPSSGR